MIDRSPTQRLEGSPTVVLAHGYALDHRYWHYQADALVEAGYRVVLWDQRGHGRSTAAESHAYSIKGLGDDLALLISEMIPHGPIVLIGHSMGGMTVMAYAGSHLEEFAQRIVGVGLISTSAGDLDKVNWGLGERGGALLARGLTALVTTLCLIKPSSGASIRCVGRSSARCMGCPPTAPWCPRPNWR
ncbi:alpha/beta fold hydrolase [Ornithinimicrobium sp. INDO-MA30-4]|uniref:alpha/beta hydrolase n=1 Tax=Ornithinimicrobium sp. INDO-MA30-4 TaxID=2908651 RepID=UPI0028834B60|nr:alpha/beta fold hydrolase [Ornithinimicrobium sp. INDO-MA30-4]